MRLRRHSTFRRARSWEDPQPNRLRAPATRDIRHRHIAQASMTRPAHQTHNAGLVPSCRLRTRQHGNQAKVRVPLFLTVEPATSVSQITPVLGVPSGSHRHGEPEELKVREGKSPPQAVRCHSLCDEHPRWSGPLHNANGKRHRNQIRNLHRESTPGLPSCSHYRLDQ